MGLPNDPVCWDYCVFRPKGSPKIPHPFRAVTVFKSATPKAMAVRSREGPHFIFLCNGAHDTADRLGATHGPRIEGSENLATARIAVAGATRSHGGTISDT